MAYEYNFEQDKCWYLSGCAKKDLPTCNSSCVRYMEIHFLMDASNIPRNRQYPVALIPSTQDVQAFNRLKAIKDNIVEFVQTGDNLYLYSSNFGNGKTSWGIKFLQKYFDEVWAGNGFKPRGLFVHVPTFLTKIREGISKKDPAFELLRSRLPIVDLVVWDDIAATKLSDFDHANLLVYIDERKLQGLSNIFTGNLGTEQLDSALGHRLSSRVWNDSIQIKLVGADRRGRR